MFVLFSSYCGWSHEISPVRRTHKKRGHEEHPITWPFLFKRWGITRQNGNKMNHSAIRKWIDSSDLLCCTGAFHRMGNLIAEVAHISNTPFFVTWLKQKVPCHDFSVHNKKRNVIRTCSQLCGLHVRPEVIVSVTSVLYSGESKEFNPQCPKAVSCTCFELMGWKTTSCNCVLFSILCGMQCMRIAEAFKSGFSSNLSGSRFFF